jgi:TonB-linked SusC/RagA family outer membrane protein
MECFVRRTRARWSLAGILLSLGAVTGAGAQQGTVAVKVTDAKSSRPVDQAQVSIVGTTLGALSNNDGNAQVRGVPAGIHVVRVIRVGYSEQKKSLNVPAGQTTNVEFALEQVPINLAPVVTTATGEVRRVELGNSVASLNAAEKVQSTPIKTMGDLLVAKAPGVQVLPANMTGAGSRVRIRGTSSLSLSNDPIYIIDGIRMTSGNGSGIGVGGTSPNRVNDLNPDEIENIEIVKGPSAATLYGTDASNGVIVITTKKGRAGRAEWLTYGEVGTIKDRNSYPVQYAILGHTAAAPSTAITCFLKDVSLGNCLKDSTVALDLWHDKEVTPIDDGNRNLLGAQLRGGTEAIRYFAAGDIQNEIGVFSMPQFSRLRLDSLKADVSSIWKRPNTLQNASFRTNLSTAVSPKIDLSVQSNFVRSDQRLPQVDNNVNSFWYNGDMGPGWKGAGPGYSGVGSIGQPLRGYAFATPAEIFQDEVTQNLQRFIGSANADWRPFSWMENRADAGVDLSDRVDRSLCRFQQCADFGTNRQGSATDARANIRNISTNITSTGSWQPRSWVNLRTTLGTQFGEFTSYSNSATGQQLPPGGQEPNNGTIPSVGDATTLTKTLGLYVQQDAAVRDRLFLEAAIRTDQNSAFGTNFQRVYYPKASASWIISDESFMPRPSWLNQLRLRTAIGASGVQPGPNDALRTFSVVTTNIGNVDVSGLRSSQLGNEALKPERATEWEGGFDSRLFGSRVNLDVTYYSKVTKDALVNLVIAPSAGSSASNQLTNLGSVKNAGLETSINATVLDRRWLGWDVTVGMSHNSNKLVTLGKTPSGLDVPSIIGTTIWQKPGYPLNGYWQRPYTWSDANKDGIITPNEVIVNGGNTDTASRFLGYSQPRDEYSITNSIELLNHRLRLTGLTDYKGGYRVLNSEGQFLCQQRTNGCFDLTSFDAPLWRQARGVANRFTAVQTQTGYIERLKFWRIREVSATYTFSDAMAERLLRGRGGSISFGARNLHVFTKWTATDPEQNYSQGDTQSTLLTAAPPAYYTVRLNIRY